MLPLRSNRKPQLLPIKQLLMKQREENSHAAEEHSVNTDDYLLWKSEQEPNEKKSVSFSLKDDGIRMKNRNQTLSEDRPFERTKHEAFLRGGVGLWDSDEADDSLQNQLETLNNLKYFDYENANLHGNSESKNRTRKKSTATVTQMKKDNNLVSKIIKNLDLPIKESVDDMQHNLSILLEKKIREEISALKKTDFLDEVNDRITSIFEKLLEFEKSQKQELLKLKSDLLNHLNTATVNQTGNCEALQGIEDRICEQIKTSFTKTLESLQDRIKDSHIEQESREVEMSAKYESRFSENTTKINELAAKIELLMKETSKILELVADTRQQNTKSVINVASRRSIAKETSFKIADMNSSNFYRSVDAELEQYRSTYTNNNFPIDQYHAKYSLFTVNDNKWKPW